TSKLLETCVPGLVGSIPTQSRQLNHIKGSKEFLSYIDQGALVFFYDQVPKKCHFIFVPLKFLY
ncbi:hypothetical protein V7659_26395, partial [Neobacillus drentensis]|uniref:hypothetical protein n=1 Tax=Neobacillus drentensis TaxID=220684 RepID=UPI002FFFCCB4